jgi:hypothetical protein
VISTPLRLHDQRRHHPSAAPAARQHFAHPSERVFAAMLDLYGVAWVYEPIEFPIRWGDTGAPIAGFRPDFWLPEFQHFVELTTADQRLVTRKNAKVRRFRELYPEFSIEVVYQRDFKDLIGRHRIALHPSAAA